MSVTRTTLLTAALAAAGLAVAGCSSSDGSAPIASGSSAPAETRVVSTDQGDVEVPIDPQRVVVLNSSLTGYFFALDAPVHGSVPLNTQSDAFPESWASDAAEAGTVQVPWTDGGFDIEAIAAEDPDLIVGGGQGFPAVQAAEAYEQLSQVAPTVLVSTDLTTWQAQLSYIAEDVLDVPDAEQELLDAYDARVAEVRAAVDLPPTPVSYLLMLPDGTPFSIPESAQLPQTLAELGLEPAPVIAENPDLETYGSGDSFELSREQVGVVITAPTVFVLGFQADTVSAADLEADPLYAGLPAFAADHAYDLPSTAHRADYAATMDLLDHVETLLG